ncbi:MAG: tetratricopeptide repeat protein [Bacteroidetes bacterium]|nr:tetratricopeptide repeat protein [Bacteroidota bacterium]
MAIKKKIISKEANLLNWKVLLLIAVSFIAFIPSLNNEFVNWDDIVYIMNNDMITTFSWAHLRQIFSTYFMGNYHPFILLSFSLDFHFFKFDAPGYHFHNLVLHLLNTFLVYVFFFRLLNKNANIAITIALLFAIHPMHVESVSWVSERKDLLYTAYFLLSLIAYLTYLRKERASYFILALLLFVFSLLSKAQAVTLPLVLLLVDYFLSRKFEWKIVFEKIPFFILSLVFGIVAVFAQKASSYINPQGIPLSQSIFYAPYGICVYLVKFLLPFYQTAVYNYPVTLHGSIPFYIYFSPVVFFVIAFALLKTWKHHKYITFGVLFFLVTVFPVLQFLPVGWAVVAERYTYVPYIGLAAIAAIAFWENRPLQAGRRRTILDASGLLIILLLFILTWNRNMVWKDSVSLWTDVMEKNPRCVSAYINRAFIFNENKRYDDALKDCSDGLKIDSTNFTLYKNRGIAYGIIGKFDLALADYSSAIKNNPADFDSYLYRGILYTDKFARHDSAIADFKKYLSHSPGNLNATFNLIVANYNKGSYDSARVYCLKVLRLNPGNEQARQLLEKIDKLKP